MTVLALEFPPVSHLFVWPAIWFDGTQDGADLHRFGSHHDGNLPNGRS